MVIGPNGSGKSALTHAICLACCGGTKDVGRDKDLSNFVRKNAGIYFICVCLSSKSISLLMSEI